MMSLRLIGQFVALISGLLISSRFGVTDDYYSALILPAALANLAINILTNLFTPVYLEYIHREPTQQQPILDSLISLVSAALILSSLLAAAAVPFSTMLRGLENNPQSLLFGFTLVLITPLLGYSRLLSLICEAHQHYRIPAAAALLNTFVFVGLFWLSAPHIGVYSLLVANLGGHLAELVLLIGYVSLKLAVRFGFQIHPHPAVREMVKLAPALTYIALFFVPSLDRIIASTVASGALSVFHYGERMVTVLDLLITTSAITTISNQWAVGYARSGIDAVTSTFNDAISILLFALIPLVIGGYVLSKPIISILFERGAFTETQATAQVFALLLLSAPLNYLIVLNVRALLIVRDVRSQVVLALGISGLNTFFNLLMTPIWGLPGIALSTLISRAVTLAASYWLLYRRLPQLTISALLFKLVRTFASVVIMLGVLLILKSPLSPTLSRANGLVAQISGLMLLIGIGAAVYGLAAHVLKHPDLDLLLHLVKA